jgi:hypothetical protein
MHSGHGEIGHFAQTASHLQEEASSSTCICGHSRGTLTKPVGFRCGKIMMSTGIARVPELSMRSVRGFFRKIAPGSELSIPKSEVSMNNGTTDEEPFLS